MAQVPTAVTPFGKIPTDLAMLSILLKGDEADIAMIELIHKTIAKILLFMMNTR
jgi:hypothetical protein